MAKGGINLNPGADATLVVAATRAGLAKTPADYSKTFENVAKSYEKTMEAQSQMWKDIGNVVGVIGADMVANAQEWNNYKDVGEENAAYLVNELEINKQAQKDLGLLPGILGDKETRDEKRRLKRKQNELFAEIDFVAKSLDEGAEAVAAGLFDENLAPQDAEMINAIIKSNLKDKITESGYQTVLSRDEKTDQLVFNLLDKDGNPVTSDALPGKRLTMTMKEFNKSIATHVKDTKNVMGTSMGTIENDIYKLAKTSGKSGIIDDQMLQMSLNKLDGLLQTDVDVRRAMQAKYGHLNTSFADDIKTKGKVSEEIYAALIRTIGAENSGQVKAEGTLAGIADTDNILGLSQEEINNAYNTYSTNILGMKDPAASKAVFKASFANRMQDAHEYGYGQRTIPSGSGDGAKTETNPYGIPKDGLRLGDPMPNGYQIKVRQDLVTGYINDIKTGGDFKFLQNDYSYEDGNWYENYGTDSEVKYESTQNMTDDVFQTGGKYFDGLVTELEIDPTTGEVEEKVTRTPETVSKINPKIDINIMKKDDDDVASYIQTLMPAINTTANPNNYQWSSARPSGRLTGGEGMLEVISLYDKEGFVVRYPEDHSKAGKKIRIKVGGNQKRREQALKDLDDVLTTFGLAKHMGGQMTAEDYVNQGVQ